MHKPKLFLVVTDKLEDPYIWEQCMRDSGRVAFVLGKGRRDVAGQVEEPSNADSVNRTRLDSNGQLC